MSRYKVTMIDAKNAEIPVSRGADFVYITGTPTLATGWALITDVTPGTGYTMEIQYCAVPVLTNGARIVILGTTIDDDIAVKKAHFSATYTGSVWKVTVIPSFDEQQFLKPDHFANIGKAFILVGNHDGDVKALDISAFIDVADGTDVITIKAGAIKLADIDPAVEIPLSYIVGTVKDKYIKSNASTGVLEEVDMVVELPDALTDLTVGTATPEKAVVLDINGQVSGLDVVLLHIGGVQVTVDAATINKLGTYTSTQAALLLAMETKGIVDTDLDNLIGIRP